METKENGNGEMIEVYYEKGETMTVELDSMVKRSKSRLMEELEWLNRAKKQAGDKTEFVLIEKPRNQTLGQAIMNAYRNQWGDERFNQEEFLKDFNKLTKEGQEEMGGFNRYANMRMIRRHWDIWGQDTQDIQEKIDALNK